MGVGTPDSATQVEDRIKADVQREAPDSNPYLTVHWLRSLIAGIARRIFDFYLDLNRTETRLFPDTADEETAPRWGQIYIGPPNAATAASGPLVAQGTDGAPIGIGVTLTAGGKEYTTTSAGTILDTVLPVNSITRSGTTATVVTSADHGLSSFVPVTITGADQPEYNLEDIVITVIGADTFQYQVEATPVTPATGTINSEFTTGLVNVQSTDFGDATNFDLDTAAALQSPLAGVNDTLHVTFDAVGGGSDAEGTPGYKARYLDKIRNPTAHFNSTDIIAEAKKINGVTRVFVEPAGTEIGTVSVVTLTNAGGAAKAITATPHGFEDGNRTTVNGADQPEYNVTDVPILVQDATTFYYLISGTPAAGTGTVSAATTIALGQVRTFFMRDNDDDPIPSPSEVATVQAQIDAIRPANTSAANNIVAAPVGIDADYIFTELTPNTATMRDAVSANLAQFHEESTTVGRDVTEAQYKAAIQNTVDPDTGDTVQTFALSAPVGDITITSGQISVLGTVTYP